MTTQFIHPSLGPVRLRISSAARHIVATWKPGYLSVTLPRGVTSGQLEQALKQMSPRLLKVRPAVTRWFEDGTLVDCGELKICFQADSRLSRCCVYDMAEQHSEGVQAVVRFSTDVDWNSAENLRGLTRLSLRLMYTAASRFLPGMVEGVFRQLGVSPKSWSVGRGQRILGTCRGDGHITISCAVMMLPEHLRRFIVCHEAAHLAHHDHSPAFHALVNRYVGGREKQLIAELKAFTWPLPRI